MASQDSRDRDLTRPPSVILRLAESIANEDAELEYSTRTEGFVLEIPQSGERIVGRSKLMELHRNRPGGRPAMKVRRVSGGGAIWVIEIATEYAPGDRWNVAVIAEVEGGLIARETRYYGQAFEAPAWRAHLSEKSVDDGSSQH